MAMAPPVSAKATLVARKKRPSVVSSSNGLQFTYEKRPGILFRAGRTTSRYVAALNRRSSSGLAPLGDGVQFEPSQTSAWLKFGGTVVTSTS